MFLEALSDSHVILVQEAQFRIEVLEARSQEICLILAQQYKIMFPKVLVVDLVVPRAP